MLLAAMAPPPASTGAPSLGSLFVDGPAGIDEELQAELDSEVILVPSVVDADADVVDAGVVDTVPAVEPVEVVDVPDEPVAAYQGHVPPEFDKADLDVDTESAEERRARFDLVINEYMQPLYGHALRLTGNPHDASDLVQATFERAFRAFHQYRPGTNLKAWLFRIQSNAFINDYRKKQRQPRLADSDMVEDWQMHQAESHTSTGLQSAEDTLLASLPDQAIIEALDSLSDDYRQAVLLADVEGLRYREIAEIMDTPVGTVMSRLHRGRRLLRIALEDYAREHGYLREPRESGDQGGDDT